MKRKQRESIQFPKTLCPECNIFLEPYIERVKEKYGNGSIEIPKRHFKCPKCKREFKGNIWASNSSYSRLMRKVHGIKT